MAALVAAASNIDGDRLKGSGSKPPDGAEAEDSGKPATIHVMGMSLPITDKRREAGKPVDEADNGDEDKDEDNDEGGGDDNNDDDDDDDDDDDEGGDDDESGDDDDDDDEGGDDDNEGDDDDDEE